MAHLITEWLTYGKLLHSGFSIFLHCTYLHGVFPLYWDQFGLGYMGVLFVMWVFLPFYLRSINSFKTSIIIGGLTCIMAGVLYNFLVLHSPLVETQRWSVWLYYMIRGIYGYSIGVIAYYARKEIPFDRVDNGVQWLFFLTFICYCILNVMIYRVDSLTFTILVGISIWLIPPRGMNIFRSATLVAAGTHIFPLYIMHVTLFYVLVAYAKMLSSGWQMVIGIGVLSVVLSVVLKRFYSDPCKVFFEKLLEK